MSNAEPYRPIWVEETSDKDVRLNELVAQIQRTSDMMYRPRRFKPIELHFKNERARRNHIRKMKKRGRHDGKGGRK